MRDRLRYHDQIFCTSSEIIEKLLKLQGLLMEHIQSVTKRNSRKDATGSKDKEGTGADVTDRANAYYSYNSESESFPGAVETNADSGVYKVDPNVAAKILYIVEYPLMHTEQNPGAER